MLFSTADLSCLRMTVPSDPQNQNLSQNLKTLLMTYPEFPPLCRWPPQQSLHSSPPTLLPDLDPRPLPSEAPPPR